jgi:hypothetical protein
VIHKPFGGLPTSTLTPSKLTSPTICFQWQKMQKLWSDGLGALMETHNSCSNSSIHLQQVYYIQWQTRWSKNSGGGCGIVVLRSRRNLWSLLPKCKHLRKSRHAAFCPRPLLWLGLCQLNLQIIGHRCVYVKFL